MSLPSILLGLLLALLIGALFHVFLDGGGARLIFYLVLSLSGAAAGQWIGDLRGIMVFPIGPLNLGLLMAGSLLFLGAGHWLSQVRGRQAHADEGGHREV
jgi:hypothetical protein